MDVSERCMIEEEIKQITICVLKALNYLHKMNIIHRDIKSANVICFSKFKKI